MIAVTEHKEGCVFAVRAQPGARKAGVQGEQGGSLKVAVTAPPEDGRANQAVLELLREVLCLRRSQIELLSGQTSRQKRLLIRGLTKEELVKRLEVLRG